MKILSTCIALLAVNGLVSGCQKREPTQPGQPTVAAAKERCGAAEMQPRDGVKMAGFAESVRRRHFDLP
jgi:hypothetical protein